MPTPVIAAVDRLFAVLGCGSIGQRHIRNLRAAGVRNIIAFDPSESRRAEVESAFGIVAPPSIEAAIAAAPQVALICSPTAFHSDHSLEFARAGCDLFIEKPVSDRLEGLETLEREVADRHLSTLVGCNFRFHPGLIKAKELVVSGQLGRLVSLRAEFGSYLPDWHPWEDYRNSYSSRKALGGGIVLDRIHEIDYVRWLAGEDIVAVSAMTGKLSGLEIDVEDTAEILLRFRSGVIGSVHVDYVRRTYDCKMEITGDAGSVVWSFPDKSVRWYLAAERVWHQLEWPAWETNLMYVEQLEHFLRVLNGIEPSMQDVAAGRAVLSAALAAKSDSDIKAAHYA